MLRVGIIDFANTLPLFFALKTNIVPHNAVFTLGKPSEINRLFSENKLDVATISAAHYVQHRLDSILLSDLGVGATRAFMSSRLFSKKAPQEMDKSPLLLPQTGGFSVKILKALCSSFWKIEPIFQTYEGALYDLFRQDVPFLTIGEESIHFLEENPQYPSFDLAETWYNFTHKSCIFGVTATRNNAFISHPQEVISFQASLEKSYIWSQQNKEEICEIAAKKINCTRATTESFLSTIEYQLTPRHFHGLDFLTSL